MCTSPGSLAVTQTAAGTHLCQITLCSSNGPQVSGAERGLWKDLGGWTSGARGLRLCLGTCCLLRIPERRGWARHRAAAFSLQGLGLAEWGGSQLSREAKQTCLGGIFGILSTSPEASDGQ